MSHIQPTNFSSLTKKDLDIIYTALTYKIRGTEKFIYETLDLNRDKFPELTEMYKKELEEERATLSAFHKMRVEMKLHTTK
jgi:hypothetical protein